ncbi:MAG: hypothetical protein IPN53_17475 [Comamonadaceae bacterium]|nr:hypothetical protein [Comamonadaceae bacterium]
MKQQIIDNMKHFQKQPHSGGIISTGLGRPTNIGATVTRPAMDSDFFYVQCCAGSMAPFMAGRVGTPQGVPVPMSGRPTPTVCHPRLVEVGRLKTCHIGANMATSITGKSAQTPAQAYKTAFDAMRAALEAIHHETMENPPERPYSGDSFLPNHLVEAAQDALKLATELREPTPVKTKKTVAARDAEFPYASTTSTVRGAFVSADYFDVEPTSDPYSPVDNEAFLKMMRLIKSGSPKHRTLGRDTIISAAEKLSDPGKHPTALAGLRVFEPGR